AVTIATNMAGRGTDIKLGAGVKEAGGLHVIGSERHDSRRIDRQLRGRCARQGDPGSSRFYISLEDNLMRLFGSDRVASIMEKMGLQEGEELSHSLLNRSIEGAQRRVEQQHFAIRKRTLEYDDVMNKQRVTIYGLRKSILLADDPRELLMDFIYTAISEKIDEAYAVRIKNEAVDFSVVREWLARTFPIGFGADLFDSSRGQESIAKGIMARIEDAYAIKVRMENPDALHWLERYIMLSAMDGVYQEHLYAMDALRQGVQLRSYGQRDPLVEYKQEAYGMFSRLMDTVKDDICANVFRLSTIAIGPAKPKPQTDIQEVHEGFNPFEGAGSGGATETAEPQRAAITVRRAQPKVGRNDPCPCGSGKKYKACCGR
ncbi:MAG: preprotein translocase subunit SecA, partial [Lentisphaerae bacterium]|nr:preprotein translocase subunit SecA [Lentisphaerota bacterium]